jgi:hypothetical protein
VSPRVPHRLKDPPREADRDRQLFAANGRLDRRGGVPRADDVQPVRVDGAMGSELAGGTSIAIKGTFSARG